MSDRFFTILPITLSFFVLFWPVKYQIEALDVLYPMVKRWSAKFSFWSGQHLGQTSGQIWSTLVKLGQSWSNLFDLQEMCSGAPSWGSFGVVGSCWVRSARSNLSQTSVKLGQPWSNLVNLGQAWSDFGKCAPDLILRLFDVASPRRIRPAWFGLPHFACQHPRKSRE